MHIARGIQFLHSHNVRRRHRAPWHPWAKAAHARTVASALWTPGAGIAAGVNPGMAAGCRGSAACANTCLSLCSSRTQSPAHERYDACSKF